MDSFKQLPGIGEKTAERLALAVLSMDFEKTESGARDRGWTCTILLSSAPEADVSAMYAVKGYPTKIVIDPEGRILKTILGESPEFYSYVDSLMK